MVKTRNTQRGPRNERLHQPRLAELVASELRRSILHGDLQDGELLPAQDELCEQFEVGKVVIRETLRILENEGLATVRRGNIGGATVHSPTPRFAARMLAMVMEARSVQASHLAAALQELEPLCATMCATRPDRTETVVPQLRSVLDESEGALEDPVEFTRLARRFHEAMVGGCGNDALIVVVGTLEAIWSPGAEGWAARAEMADSYPDISGRRAALRTHERISTLIAEGKADSVARLVRDHLTLAQRYSLANDPDRPVTVEEFG
jgi:GntR family transcriptional regulator, transcriptional repressor for pyruvate dehydrogenase complex